LLHASLLERPLGFNSNDYMVSFRKVDDISAALDCSWRQHLQGSHCLKYEQCATPERAQVLIPHRPVALLNTSFLLPSHNRSSACKSRTLKQSSTTQSIPSAMHYFNQLLVLGTLFTASLADSSHTCSSAIPGCNKLIYTTQCTASPMRHTVPLMPVVVKDVTIYKRIITTVSIATSVKSPALTISGSNKVEDARHPVAPVNNV